MNGPRGQALADNITKEEVFKTVDNASLKWTGQALLITSRNGTFKVSYITEVGERKVS